MENIKPKILQICGLKNTGKTTLLCDIIKILKTNGLKTAVIKHDGHDFSTSHYLEDNFQHFNSGADISYVFSNSKILKVEQKKSEIEDIISEIVDVDIILIEGCKNSNFPKIEVLRRGISEIPISNPKNRIALFSDFPFETKENLFLDKEMLLTYILKKYKE